MSGSHPLAGFHKFDPEERLAIDERVQEAKLVKALLNWYKQPPQVVSEVYEWTRKKSGVKELRLPALRMVTGICDKALIESAVLGSEPKQYTLDKMFRRFDTRPLTVRYFERYEERNENLTGLIFALVVKWPYMPVGLVLHNSDRSIAKGTRFRVKTGDHVLTLEPFDQFMRYEIKP